MRKVIGIGETILDIIFRNGQPTAAVPGGSVFNGIVSLARTGVPVSFISETGNDQVGNTILQFMQDSGMSTEYVNVFPDGKSPVSLAYLNEHGDAEYIFYKDYPKQRLDVVFPKLEEDDIVVFGSYFALNPVLRDKVQDLLEQAREKKAIVYYDPNFRSSHKDEAIKLTSTIIENLEYADIVRGSIEDFFYMYNQKELEKGNRKQFIVLHTYGSHFNYRERYPETVAFFLPDFPVDAEVKYKDNLMNAYDNSIRYTDNFLARIIHLLKQQQVDASMLYTSDHGEDIFDDGRHLFLHASPVPSYYQLHVPLLLWTSDSYREEYPGIEKAASMNRQKNISSSISFFQTMMELAGIETPYRNDSLSVTSPLYTEKSRVYLNDHNEPHSLDDIGMRKEDFEMLKKRGIDAQ